MAELSNVKVKEEDISIEKDQENTNEIESEVTNHMDENGETLEDKNQQTSVFEEIESTSEASNNDHEVDEGDSKVNLKEEQSEKNEDDTSKIEDLKISGEGNASSSLGAQGRSDQPGWGWNSWKGWGSSVITNAATQVTQFTNQVGDGLLHVLEPVDIDEDDDNTVVIDNPNKGPIKDQSLISPIESTKDTENSNAKDTTNTIDDDDTKETVALGTVIESNKSPWWISGLSNVVNKTTSVFQQTTKTVVHGGLDVLEVMGKKTYDIITEGDHGLKKVISKNKERKKLPNLSQVLSEAKEISEMRSREEESQLEEKKFMYSYWFDEYQGLLQLEAFELLCRENEIRTRQEYERLEEGRLEAVKETLGNLNDVYKPATTDDEEEEEEDEEDDDADDFGQCLMEYAAKLPVVLNVQKMLQCQEETRRLLEEYEQGKEVKLVAKDLYKQSLRCMAHLTSLSIQHYHKLAQLLLRSPSSSSTPGLPSSSPLESSLLSSLPQSSSSSSPLDDSLSSSSSSSPFAHVTPIETAVIIVDFSKVLRREMTIESNKFVSVLAALESEKEKTTAKKTAEHKENTEKSTSDDKDEDDEGRDDTKDGKSKKGVSLSEGDGGEGGEDDYNEQITSVYLEAANSVKFVVRSLKLLLPALQIAIINEAVVL